MLQIWLPLNCLAMVLQEKPDCQNEECCSYTSSNRESWGRCSSLGGSDEESSADCTAAENGHQVSLYPLLPLWIDLLSFLVYFSNNFFVLLKTLKVFATPLRTTMQQKSGSTKEEKKKKAPPIPKKPKSEKLEKLEALSRRLRHCILKRVNHRRHRSS